MKIQNYVLIFLLIAFIQLVNAKVIASNNLTEALSQVEPGDTIELKTGPYKDVPYRLKNGTSGKPIKIKSAPNSYVDIIGKPYYCIFEDDYIHDVIFEGPMVLRNALCGFRFGYSSNINITGIAIYNMRRQSFLMLGNNFTIFNNIIKECVLENKEIEKSQRRGLYQYKCISIWNTNQVNIISNIISNSYGASVELLFCQFGIISENEIKKWAFCQSIY